MVLDLAVHLARERGTSPRDELFALPRFSRTAYWRLLAEALGLGFVSDPGSLRPDPAMPHPGLAALREARQTFAMSDGMQVLLLAPDAAHLPALRRLLHHSPRTAARIRIAPPETIRAVLAAGREAAHAHVAAQRLARTAPASSASNVPRRRWLFQAAVAFAALAGATVIAPRPVWIGIDLLLGLFFLHGIMWKLAAALHRRPRRRRRALSDAALPTYSVLVPLYDEANMVADLVAALGRLDYPASKLQIILVLEADDRATRAAVLRHARSSMFQLVIVPPSVPRTKPKALVYALPFARGDVVCVFDAEDRPTRGQLREAAAALAADRRLACVQARLTPDNRDSWLARMFSIEYAANFDVLLPALADWGIVLPLGGTSNHFRGIR